MGEGRWLIVLVLALVPICIMAWGFLRTWRGKDVRSGEVTRRDARHDREDQAQLDDAEERRVRGERYDGP